MRREDTQLYEFGPFRLNPKESLLLRDHQPVALAPRAFDVLLRLVQDTGSLIEKEELMKRVWGDTIVEEGNLNQAIHQARKALGDDSADPRYIQTVLKRGYRFIADVQVISNGNGAGAAEERAAQPDAVPISASSAMSAIVDAPPGEPATDHRAPGADQGQEPRAVAQAASFKRWIVVATAVISAAFVFSAAIIAVTWWRVSARAKHVQVGPVQIEAPFDEGEAKRVVKESQFFETLTIYTNPRGFDRSQLARYWVPAEEGGQEIKVVERAIDGLITRGLHFCPGSKAEMFEFRYARILAPGDISEVGTMERWHIPHCHEDGSLAPEINVNLGPIQVDYRLRKINGVWLIQENTVPRPRNN